MLIKLHVHEMHKKAVQTYQGLVAERESDGLSSKEASKLDQRISKAHAEVQALSSLISQC